MGSPPTSNWGDRPLSSPKSPPMVELDWIDPTHTNSPTIPFRTKLTPQIQTDWVGLEWVDMIGLGSNELS